MIRTLAMAAALAVPTAANALLLFPEEGSPTPIAWDGTPFTAVTNAAAHTPPTILQLILQPDANLIGGTITGLTPSRVTDAFGRPSLGLPIEWSFAEGERLDGAPIFVAFAIPGPDRCQDNAAGGGGCTDLHYFDNLKITAAPPTTEVPEPLTLSLLLAGVITATMMRKLA